MPGYLEGVGIVEPKLSALKQMIDENNSIVFFGGAGVSTESGIPDFRSADGLYNQQHQYPPEEIISHSFFMRHPEEFYRFYRNNMVAPDARPNAAHIALTKLEKMGKLQAVITQNIDGLHQMAGSKHVLELHGSVHRNFCMNCHKGYGLETVLEAEEIPYCSCGGMIKPDVVLYEEPLDAQTLNNAVMLIEHADMLLVGGTSLAVYPAAGLIQYYRGNKLILINRDATPYDAKANLVLHESIGKVLSGVIDG